MTTRDSTRSNGSRYRAQNDREVVHVVAHDIAPEWGNLYTCVACWQHNLNDLTRHRQQFCEDWNPLNRLNLGFNRQFSQGLAPLDTNGNYPATAYVLKGEHYRMVKGRYGIMPHHIMRWQDENYGPYDPLQAPPGVHVFWSGFSYWQLLQETLLSLPISIATTPRDCSCSRALARSKNGTSHSYFQEKNALDELADQAAVGQFMAAHPPIVGMYQGWSGVSWNNTQPRMARTSRVPLNGRGVWVDLAPPTQGVCGEGDRGIAESNAQHFLQHQAAVAVGQPTALSNLYQGKTINDARRGDYTMPGTPRH